MNQIEKKHIALWFQDLQNSICQGLEQADGAGRFEEDNWERMGGGGGKTRTMSEGKVIEKGGVNFSEVFGQTPTKILEALKLGESDFYATGVSIVLHPRSPMVPIIHMNVRYFEMGSHWWFGGGIDLTPHYIDTGDAQFFHQQLHQVCQKHHPSYYQEFKKWADDYFYLKHREETRGIGGIFFDRLSDQDGFTKNQRWEFVQDVGRAFVPIYSHLMEKNNNLPYEATQQQWQYVRRGRYVEFNLVWDKGTKFGLDTGGRTESILMSLPPQANWLYNYQPQPGTPEFHTQQMLKKDINWIDGAGA
jgi:coproporphyrinogen III oxidase